MISPVSFLPFLNIVGIFSVLPISSSDPICEDKNRIDIKGSRDARKVALGDELVLLCCTGRREVIPTRLVWVLPDTTYAPEFTRANGGVYTMPGGGGSRSVRLYLVFRNITRKQLGLYSCEAENSGSNIPTASINVIQRTRLVIDAPSVQWARLGKPGQLVCDARGHEMLKVAWYYRGRLLSTSSSGRTTLQGRAGSKYILANGGKILKILPKVERGNGGQYMCKAEVETDEEGDLLEVKPIKLLVYQSPEIKKISVQTASRADENGQKLAVEGQDITLFCHVKSFPDARIEWFKDGQLVKQGFHFKKAEININQDNYMLIYTLAIRKFRKSDIGKYTCNATLHILKTNITDVVSKSYYLDAILKPEFSPLQNMNVTTVENATVLLKCNAFGAWDPLMQMNFYRHGKKIRTNRYRDVYVSKVTDPENKKKSTLILEFRAIRPTDAGEYKCVAETDAGRTEMIGKVVVRYAPRIINKTDDTHGWRGHRTNLRCRAVGSPSPKWRWYMNGRLIQIDNNVIREEGYINGISSGTTLFVQPNFDNDRVFGEYTCVATNDFGQDKATIVLVRARRPGLPDITITEAHGTSIKMQLKKPRKTGGAPLSHYQLRYKVFKGSEKKQWNANGHFFGPYDIALDRDLNIRGMMPHATYEFHIAAVNRVGPGLEQVLNFTTDAIGNPEPVQIVSLLSTEDPSIHLLKWKPNGNGGFPIRHYRIRIRPVELDPSNPGFIKKGLGDWVEYNVFNGLSLNVKNLRPFTHYQVKIQARTAFGASERSALFKTKGQVGRTSALRSFPGSQPSIWNARNVYYCIICGLLTNIFINRLF